MRSLFAFIGRLLDRIICLVLAIAFTQVPVYVDQYIDVLSGARTEAKKLYDELSATAAKYHLDVDAYLTRIEANPDSLVSGLAIVNRNAVNRYLEYEAAWNALQNAPGWLRPIVLMNHFDKDLGKALQFQAGLSFTFTAFLYAVAGLLVGMALVGLVSAIFRKRTPKAKA